MDTCLTGPEQRLVSSRVVLGGFPAEISSIRFFIVVCSVVRLSNCMDRFRIASRSYCDSSCFCGPLSAEDEETDFFWHGGNSSLSENSSSRISFLTGGPAQCLLGTAKVWFCFGVLQPGQRDLRLAGIINTRNTTTHGASEPTDTTHEVTK